MREPSKYMSQLLTNQIWPDFSQSLKTKQSKLTYFSALCMICDYLKSDFLDITSSQAQSYFDYLQVPKPNSKKHTLKTLYSKLSIFRSLATFVIENSEHYNIPTSFTNVFYNVNLPEGDDYLDATDIPTLKELDLILQAASDNPMVYLILAMVIRCGFTASEVCRLKLSQIHEDAASRFCVTFSDKIRTRYVKLPEDIVTLLLKYKETLSIHDDYLFHNKKGLVLKVRNLESLIKSYVSTTGINKNYTIQDIRNAAIYYMKAAGAEDHLIADYVGIDTRWMYRYNRIVDELKDQAVDYVKIRIIK